VDGGSEEELQPDSTAPRPASSVISFQAAEFPWWLVAMVAIIVAMATLVVVNDEYRQAFKSILPWPASWTKGLALTLVLTIGSFFAATFLGLFIALARLATYNGRRWYRPVLFLGAPAAVTALILFAGTVTATSASVLAIMWMVGILASWKQGVAVVIIRNTATLYIEFVRGIPMLVFIFAIALVIVPDFVNLLDIESRAVSQAWRGAAALSLFYAAFIAEVFRAGIQSVPGGQIEAGRSVGLTEGQIMRKITLPQAVRNMLPALGNDLISLMKDTSLVSVLAVNELTQMARLYSGSTFRFREAFFVLAILYVTLTLVLSLILRWYERRISIPGD